MAAVCSPNATGRDHARHLERPGLSTAMVSLVAFLAIGALTLALLSHFDIISAGSAGTISLFAAAGLGGAALAYMLARARCATDKGRPLARARCATDKGRPLARARCATDKGRHQPPNALPEFSNAPPAVSDAQVTPRVPVLSFDFSLGEFYFLLTDATNEIYTITKPLDLNSEIIIIKVSRFKERENPLNCFGNEQQGFALIAQEGQSDLYLIYAEYEGYGDRFTTTRRADLSDFGVLIARGFKPINRTLFHI